MSKNIIYIIIYKSFLFDMKKFSLNINKSLIFTSIYNFTKSDGTSFLKMVESYFDKAGRHTDIKPDKLNFYKKP
jgi:hypothetical protein